MKRISTLALAVVATAMTMVSCQKENQVPQEQAYSESIGRMLQTADMMERGNAPRNPLASARSQARFSVLTTALARTGLMNTLMKLDGEYTLFAPTDAAFAAAGITVSSLNGLSREALTSILLYHVVGEKITAAQVPASAAQPTLNGEEIYVRKVNGNVFVNLAQVTSADAMAKNGVVHVINQVLLPPTQTIAELAISNGFTTLVAAAVKAGLAAALSDPNATPITVFAPTNDGFEAEGIDLDNFTSQELQNVLLYHVVGGNGIVFSNQLSNTNVTMANSGTVQIILNGGAFVKGTANSMNSQITAADYITKNGIVHVINRVLLP
jgi:uncharacterized surface protein with fasciclin (FAS1) repeats